MKSCKIRNKLKNYTNQLLENLETKKYTHLLQIIFGVLIQIICNYMQGFSNNILGKCLNFIDDSLVPSTSAKHCCYYQKFCQHQQKKPKKQRLNFSRGALFHKKIRFSLKYFVTDCLWKPFIDSNSSQTPSNLISLTILVTLRFLTLF